jgi:butyrate kinase
MSVVLALFAEYRGTRLGVSKDGQILTGSVPPGEDAFQQGEALAGASPSIVVVPGGVREHPWHPLSRLEAEARCYSAENGIRMLVVDPMSSADLVAEARFSGYKEYERRGVFYAVPQRAAYEKAVETLSLPAAEARVITVYLGDEVSVSAHRGRRIVDTSDPVACEGPFGFTSAGTPPATAFVSWVAQRGGDRSPGAAFELRETLKEGSGAFAYAGVGDQGALSEALSLGQEGAVTGISGMAYQIAKEIGRQMAALRGRVDAVVLCGPGASLTPLISGVTRRTGKWVKVLAFMKDLAIPFLLQEGNAALSSKPKTR